MVEILAALKEVSPFIALVGIIYVYFQMRGKDSANSAQAAALEHEAAKFRADAEKRRDEREDRLALALATEQVRRTKVEEQTALIMAQTSTALIGLLGVQKQTTGAVRVSEKHVVSQVEGAKGEIIASVEKAQELIGQVLTLLVSSEDDSARLVRIERAIDVLREQVQAGDTTAPESVPV